jgi:hypothetical protein
VEAGLGAGFLWTFVAHKLPDLQRVGPCDPTLTIGLWAFARDDVPLERSAREVMRQIHLVSTPD